LITTGYFKKRTAALDLATNKIHSREELTKRNKPEQFLGRTSMDARKCKSIALKQIKKNI
jgi:hypothetical protein